MIDEPSNADFRVAGETDGTGADRGRESVSEGPRRPAGAIELGPSADRILIQSWKLLKSRQGRGD